MRAYLQLVRVPNVFTAMADILLGFLLTHERLEPWPQFALLLGASCLFYMAGMALNDLADVKIDREQRPDRPIASGRVSPMAALIFVAALFAIGLGKVLCRRVGRRSGNDVERRAVEQSFDLLIFRIAGNDLLGSA